MIRNLILAIGSAGAAFVLWPYAGLARGAAGGFDDPHLAFSAKAKLGRQMAELRQKLEDQE